jgi:hypothetical protein
MVTVSAQPQKPAIPVQKTIKNRETSVTRVDETNGGYIVQVDVRNFQKHSRHTIILSKALYEDLQQKGGRVADVATTIKCVIRFMQDKGMPLDNTEGMIDSGVFPVNYFSVRQLSCFYPDAVESLVRLVSEGLEV